MQDRRFPVTALRTAWFVAAGLAAFPPTAFADGDAAAVFAQNCGACHQADGGGTPGLAPPVRGPHLAKLLHERSYLVRVAAFGMTGSIRVGDSVFMGAMPAQSQLDDAQLAEVLNYVVSDLNAAALPQDWRPYDADEVAALRKVPHASIEQSRLRKSILGP